MKQFLISDNVDTLMGMRLVGIEGALVHSQAELHQVLTNVAADETIALVLITTIALNYDADFIYDAKLNWRQPLIVEVPDRHDSVDIGDVINTYISSAIGMKG